MQGYLIEDKGDSVYWIHTFEIKILELKISTLFCQTPIQVFSQKDNELTLFLPRHNNNNDNNNLSKKGHFQTT